MAQSFITAGDASSGTQVSSGNDGTLVLQTGPAGSKLNALSFASDGTPTLFKAPKLDATAAVSMIKVNTANGFGSTATAIRRFTNITNGSNGCIIQGSDISFVDNVANGSTFTINTSGIYSISYNDGSSTGTSWAGISLNTATPATALTSLPMAEVLVAAYTGGVNAIGCVSWTGYIAAGAVIRPHTSMVTVSSPNMTSFTITKVL